MDIVNIQYKLLYSIFIVCLWYIYSIFMVYLSYVEGCYGLGFFASLVEKKDIYAFLDIIDVLNILGRCATLDN